MDVFKEITSSVIMNNQEDIFGKAIHAIIGTHVGYNEEIRNNYYKRNKLDMNQIILFY